MLGSKGNSPRKNQSNASYASSGGVSNTMPYPGKLATVHVDSFDKSGELPKFRRIKRRKAKTGGDKLGLLRMNTLAKGQKSLAEVIGWRSHSREQAIEEESRNRVDAAWSSSEGLDVEKIYDQLHKP